MSHTQLALEPETRRFYVDVLNLMVDSGIPFMVGGAYALAHYSAIERHTRDLDLFLHERDVPNALELLAAGGYRSELTFPHWLGKAYYNDTYVDLIFSSGNAIADVDDEWFTHAPTKKVFDVEVKLCPAEEMIWSKSFIMERERFDGADVIHILQTCADKLDWDRLLRRFSDHWRVLLTHLILFGYVFPAEKDKIPKHVMNQLLMRLKDDRDQDSEDKICQGTVLSREQYLPDLKLGYNDSRLQPVGNMSAEEIDIWTRAIATK